MESKKLKLLYIQPILASYRADLLKAFDTNYELCVLSSTQRGTTGFSEMQFNGKHYLVKDKLFIKARYQMGAIKVIRESHPSVILTFANPYYISFWASLIYAKLTGIKFISHGQGLYSHQPPGFIRKMIYRLITKLSDRYICYTELSRETLINIGCNNDKLRVADNSITIKEICPPEDKKFCVNGVLFIGRIRESCGLDILIETIVKLRDTTCPDIELHIIGDGILKEELEKKFKGFDFIHWYGKIYEEEKIKNISLNCIIGCYPGNAGLSIVHFMSLTLSIVVHNNISQHMGPEVSYINNNVNGMMFNYEHYCQSLSDVLYELYSNRELVEKIARNGYETYINLSHPSMEEKFIKHINEVL